MDSGIVSFLFSVGREKRKIISIFWAFFLLLFSCSYRNLQNSCRAMIKGRLTVTGLTGEDQNTIIHLLLDKIVYGCDLVFLFLFGIINQLAIVILFG